MAARSVRRRGVVDTSVLVAGIAGFKVERPVQNPSASFLRNWVERGTFVWLLSEEILAEYKAVLSRLGVQRSLVATVINPLREEAGFVNVHSGRDVSPDPSDNPFCNCAEQGKQISSVL